MVEYMKTGAINKQIIEIFKGHGGEENLSKEMKKNSSLAKKFEF
jgi:hypothetical protein